MQSVSSRIWTRVAVSISYDDNHYTTGTSFLKILPSFSCFRQHFCRHSLQFSSGLLFLDSVSIFLSNPSKIDQRIFKQGVADLNSKFSFSNIDWCTKAKEPCLPHRLWTTIQRYRRKFKNDSQLLIIPLFPKMKRKNLFKRRY